MCIPLSLCWHLQVFEGVGHTGQPVLTITGTGTQQSYTSEGSVLTLWLSTDGSLGKSGFTATASGTCGLV